jgi:hypothetical protein
VQHPEDRERIAAVEERIMDVRSEARSVSPDDPDRLVGLAETAEEARDVIVGDDDRA